MIKASYRDCNGGGGCRVRVKKKYFSSGGRHEIIKPINLTTQWHKHEHLTKKREKLYAESAINNIRPSRPLKWNIFFSCFFSSAPTLWIIAFLAEAANNIYIHTNKYDRAMTYGRSSLKIWASEAFIESKFNVYFLI